MRTQRPLFFSNSSNNSSSDSNWMSAGTFARRCAAAILEVG